MGNGRSGPEDRPGADGAFGYSHKRYAHFAPSHASRSIIEAQRKEAERLAQQFAVGDKQETLGNGISEEIPPELVSPSV